MAVRKSGLGKGLDSLIPNYYSEKTNSHEGMEDTEKKNEILSIKIFKSGTE